MNDKIIFLDFDGVITSARTGWYNLDIYAVNFLRWICREAPAKIVISSTWRKKHDKTFFSSIFEGYLHDDHETPDFRRSMCRGEEISDWLSRHEVSKYLCLDDDSADMGEHPLIKTNSFNGLLFDDMLKIREYFEILTTPKENRPLYQSPNMFANLNMKSQP